MRNTFVYIKTKMRFNLTLITLSFCTIFLSEMNVQAQDPEFTQFYAILAKFMQVLSSLARLMQA